MYYAEINTLVGRMMASFSEEPQVDQYLKLGGVDLILSAIQPGRILHIKADFVGLPTSGDLARVKSIIEASEDRYQLLNPN